MEPNQQEQLKAVSLKYAEYISPGELEDLLKAIQTLKTGSGWGNIEMVYQNAELNSIDIIIKIKPKKKLEEKPNK